MPETSAMLLQAAAKTVDIRLEINPLENLKYMFMKVGDYIH